MKITSKTKIKKILEECPDSILILMEYGLMCAGCSLSGNHGLEETKKIYGFTDKDIKDMVRRINNLISKKKK